MQYRAVCYWISHRKSRNETPAHVYSSSTDPNTTRLASVYEQYEARLRQANALDLDHLLLETVHLRSHDTSLRLHDNRSMSIMWIDALSSYITYKYVSI